MKSERYKANCLAGSCSILHERVENIGHKWHEIDTARFSLRSWEMVA